MENFHVIFGLGMCALIFIIVGHYYRDKIQLRLKKELFVYSEDSLDLWSVSHFVLFFLFGVFEPNKHLTFFNIGICFEILEDMLSSDKTTQLCDCMHQEKNNVLQNTLFCNGYNDGYWYAKFSDVFVNLVGYTCGSAFTHL